MMNQLFYGDNLEIIQKYVADNSVDLCYIDPPFNSKRDYNQIYNNIGKEDTAQAQAFTDTWVWNAAAQKGFVNITQNENGAYTMQATELIIGLKKVLGEGSLFAYIVSKTQCIAEIYRVLKPTGTFYLHCDPTASHYLKLVCDAIFTPNGGVFRNEIIWHYKTGGVGKKWFSKKHDIILGYVKSKKTPFYPMEVKEYYRDDNGKTYKPGFPDRKGGEDEGGYYRYAYMDDVWNIPAVFNMSKERLGYPTQKPEALLERIIKSSTNEGDVVLDAYCGCGTTIAVAQRLGRSWIGVDITYQSISLILKRLEDSFGGDFTHDLVDKATKKMIRTARLELMGVPMDFESAVALANKKDDRVRKEFEKWSVLTFSNNRAIINDKKGGDRGIDGTAFLVDINDKNEQIFEQVIFSVKSGKTLGPDVIRDLAGTLVREKAAIGYLITLYPMPNLIKEAQQYGTYTNRFLDKIYPKIEVINIQEMLDGKRIHLPSVAVVKSAERKQKNGTKNMFDDDETDD